VSSSHRQNRCSSPSGPVRRLLSVTIVTAPTPDSVTAALGRRNTPQCSPAGDLTPGSAATIQHESPAARDGPRRRSAGVQGERSDALDGERSGPTGASTGAGSPDRQAGGASSPGVDLRGGCSRCGASVRSRPQNRGTTGWLALLTPTLPASHHRLGGRFSDDVQRRAGSAAEGSAASVDRGPLGGSGPQPASSRENRPGARRVSLLAQRPKRHSG
jgi:hypothetical protein